MEVFFFYNSSPLYFIGFLFFNVDIFSLQDMMVLSDAKIISYVIAVLLGIADSGFNTQVSLNNILFPVSFLPLPLPLPFTFIMFL